MAQRRLSLRFLAEPQHVNFGGKVHGGQVMKWIDQAAYACASSYSGRYCVTAYVGGIQFKEPIRIGEIVEVSATVILTGRTSMHIAVEVNARDPKVDVAHDTTHCVLVFVALDDNNKPIDVPSWNPTEPHDVALQEYALRLKVLEANAIEARSRIETKKGT